MNLVKAKIFPANTCRGQPCSNLAATKTIQQYRAVNYGNGSGCRLWSFTPIDREGIGRRIRITFALVDSQMII